jgi:hypothetical protein
MEYTLCPKNLWLKKHKPTLFENITLSDFQQEIILNGQIVDEASMVLFPDGELATSKDLNELDYSKQLIANKNNSIFQGSFEWGNFFVRTDVLHFDEETGSWSLYEVKATNSVKKSPYSHIKDLTFQKLVLNANDITVGYVGVIHLNRDYRRIGQLDYKALFQATDVTVDVLKMESIVSVEMTDLEKYLDGPEKSSCPCLYKGRSAQCQTFSYSNPSVPDYSVHDISRIGNSPKKLADWINRGIYSIDDIDNPEILNSYQSFQYLAHIKNQAVIDSKEIQTILNDLEFPIHFLDYESYSSAIPEFDGFGPWQQIPFQYSIHVLNEDGSLEHKEYLITEPSKDITLGLVERLAEDVNERGSVVVWYETFEKTRNSELAALHSGYADFLYKVNDRVFDLMKIFSNGHYINPDFGGSNRIKTVLPVLIPDLSYTALEIQTGNDAPVSWKKMINKGLALKERKTIEENLLEYCGLDTLAMVRIYEFLKNI